MPTIDEALSHRFRTAVVVLALIYCALQMVYISRLPMVMDEFDGAYEAHRLRHQLPYRDFAPYKTVLGYYIETAGTFASSTVWGRIIAVKLEIALINTAMLALASLYASRFLRRPAVMAALLFLIVCSTFLERSSELRVDMLTAWAGLWSMLFLFDERFVASGVAAGLSFLISQKGAFFIAAGFTAIAAYGLLQRRLRPLLQFTAAVVTVPAVYIAIWSAIASLHVVLDATIIGGARAALLGGYDIRWRFWKQILLRDGGYFLISAAAIGYLAARRNAPQWRHVCTVVYAVTVVVQTIAYSQPWPYFFVVLFPTLFVLHAVFFDAAQERRPSATLGIGKGWVLTCLLLAAVYPAQRILVVLHRSNDYQHYNVDLAEALLGPGDTYLAGTDILHDHEQALPALARLGWPVMAELRGRNRSSLQPLIAAFDKHPPKVIIGNYRMYALPPPFPQTMLGHYARLSGSIWSYAPVAAAGRCFVAFDGRYWIDAQSSHPVMLDGSVHQNLSMVRLQKGLHAIGSDGAVRLRLAPEGMERALDPRYREEQDFYPHVYDY